jgi:hypothetical protein
MKKVIVLLFMLCYSFVAAQEHYKYAIVPKKFSFFNTGNDYDTSLMTKAFFESEGFIVYFDTDNFPPELANNRCLAFYVNALKQKNIFITKINFELIDCANSVIYTSSIGSSREKDYLKAYNESFRMALMGMKGKLIFKREQKQQNEIFVAVESPSKSDVVPDPVKEDSTKKTNNKQLFAIPTANGYKIVNDEPKKILTLYSTSIKDVFIAEKENFTGLFMKKENMWYFEYYLNGQLISEKVEVAF